ncbi:MAG: SOS response-associated peptidase [Planctomycetota bacterium]
MCGRFTLRTLPNKMIQQVFAGLDLGEIEQQTARVNIAPTQNIPVIRTETGQAARDDGPIADLARWGLLPPWAKELSLGARMINARSETVAEKPAFRSAYRSRRCVIPADGYIEWVKQADGKQPYWMHHVDDQHEHAGFFFAGLWERNSQLGKDVSSPLHSATILTTVATEQLSSIHDRMPVVLTPAGVDAWLMQSADIADLSANSGTLFPEDFFTITPISRRINSVRNQSEDDFEVIDD